MQPPRPGPSRHQSTTRKPAQWRQSEKSSAIQAVVPLCTALAKALGPSTTKLAASNMQAPMVLVTVVVDRASTPVYPAANQGVEHPAHHAAQNQQLAHPHGALQQGCGLPV